MFTPILPTRSLTTPSSRKCPAAWPGHKHANRLKTHAPCLVNRHARASLTPLTRQALK